MKQRSAGFTVTELVVVIGIIMILMSLIYPIAATMRLKAKKTQCGNNMTQLHEALTMYSIDNNRVYETYPVYLTNLFGITQDNGIVNGAYINDDRVFICPMDDSKATVNTYGVTALKPIYSINPPVPADDKHDWAERFSNGMSQRNSSYLYEFSGRICETYIPDDFGGSWNYEPSTFCDSYLVSAVDHFFYPDPWEIVRDGIPQADGSTGITWQDAKFFQLHESDVYLTGVGFSPDNYPDPPPNFEDPSDWYFDNNIDPENQACSYSRTWMPIVRCFYHQTLMHIDSEAYEEVLNLALDGNIFSSSPYWERTAFKYGSKVGETPQN